MPEQATKHIELWTGVIAGKIILLPSLFPFPICAPQRRGKPALVRLSELFPFLDPPKVAVSMDTTGELQLLDSGKSSDPCSTVIHTQLAGNS